MIHATMLGRLGRDAEIKTTNSGKEVCSFSIATDSGFGDRKETIWVSCTIWGDRASRIAGHLVKGTSVVVTGELKPREFQKRDGTGGFGLELSVREMEFAGKREEGHAPAARQQPRHAPAQAHTSEPIDDDIPF